MIWNPGKNSKNTYFCQINLSPYPLKYNFQFSAVEIMNHYPSSSAGSLPPPAAPPPIQQFRQPPPPPHPTDPIPPAAMHPYLAHLAAQLVQSGRIPQAPDPSSFCAVKMPSWPLNLPFVPNGSVAKGEEPCDSGNETSSLSPGHTPMTASPSNSRSNSFSGNNNFYSFIDTRPYSISLSLQSVQYFVLQQLFLTTMLKGDIAARCRNSADERQ